MESKVNRFATSVTSEYDANRRINPREPPRERRYKIRFLRTWKRVSMKHSSDLKCRHCFAQKTKRPSLEGNEYFNTPRDDDELCWLFEDA